MFILTACHELCIIISINQWAFKEFIAIVTSQREAFADATAGTRGFDFDTLKMI
jgi:hypothetical protein